MRTTGLINPARPVNWSAPLNRGLVSWWRVVRNSGWRGGLTWRDLCRRNHGTLTGGPLWTGPGDASAAGALFFDGSDDWANFGDVNAVDGATALTFAILIRFRTFVDFDGIMVKDSNDNSRFGMFLGGTGAGNNSGLLLATGNGSNSFGAVSSLFTLNKLHHIVMRFDGAEATNATRLRCWTDGVERSLTYTGTIPATTASNTANLGIAAGRSAGATLHCDVLDARIYNRAISANEACLLNQASRTGYRRELQPPPRRYAVWSLFVPALPLAAGAITAVDTTPTSVQLLGATPTGGFQPITQQWYMSTTEGFTPGAGNILAGETALALSKTGLTPNTTYYFVLRYTDAAASTLDVRATVVLTPIILGPYYFDEVEEPWLAGRWQSQIVSK